MPPAFGGETPLVPYGVSNFITLEAPTGTTESAPVEVGDLFKIAGGATAADGSGYKAVALEAGDDPQEVIMVMAAERRTVIREMGFIILSPHVRGQIRRIKYQSGSAPSIGQSIVTNATNPRRIEGQSFAVGEGYVMKVDTTNLDAETLL
jgi:hypothetical protein